MAWKAFSPELQKFIRKRGFLKPTAVQEEGTPRILGGKNTLLLAPTGLGKTESVMLPVFDMWLEGKHEPISILYITPLRSLNRDLLKRIVWWARELDFEVSVRHGDTTQYERSMQAANPADMFISTPETLQAILTGPVMRGHLKNVKWVVVDEIHELVGSKRGVQLSVGLERLRELAGRDFQVIGLSATVGSPEDVAEFLTGGRECDVVNTAKVRKFSLRVESPEPTTRDASVAGEIYVGVDVAARLRRIKELIDRKTSVLAFTNTRESSEILSSRLREMDSSLPVETHHSSLSKEVRIKAEEDFKSRKLKALLCTSSLELGIDIGSIDFILQYMSPRQVIKILQRVGRSGHRLDKVSDGVIISSDPDDCFESAVIAELALSGEMEPTQIYGSSLDVLGHQIVGLALEEYKIPVDSAYEIIRRAHPFQRLSRDGFLRMCLLMQKLGYLWVDEKYSEVPVLKRRRPAWEYYYRNLSTIPDTRNYQIFDVVSRQPVGTLDAEFIALHGEPGTAFICKGQAWKTIDIQGDRVNVEPMSGIEAAIPAWEGELIPVPRRVAMLVGELRDEVANKLRLGERKVVEHIIKKWPVSRNVAKKMLESVKKQAKWGPVPGKDDMLIEYWSGVVGRQEERGNYVIIHSCRGSLINETLGRVLSTMLTNKLGSVGLQTDPYRIILKLQAGSHNDVLDTLKELESGMVKSVLELSLPNTELFRWRFLHVAKRLGVISRDADYGKAYLRKVVESYHGSPVHREAINEIEQEKLDMEGAERLLKDFKTGKLNATVREGLSPFGEFGLARKYEIVAPERPEHEIFKVFKERVLSTKVGLVCCQCGDWSIVYSVRNAPDKPACRKCRAGLIAVVPAKYVGEAEKLMRKHLAKRKLTKEEEKHVKYMMDSAALVIGRGIDAIKVLAGRGIGPRTASRVLARAGLGDELFRDILEAERAYARTRRFWGD